MKMNPRLACEKLFTWKRHAVEGLTRKRKRLVIPRSIVNELEGHYFPDQSLHSIQGENDQLINEIRLKTKFNNRSNVTRTAAYFEFYKKHPEINWALLAHMVSRNGGWNMTDLKGSIIPKYLTVKQTNYFFSFLEKANAIIFNDAYPQLLLYEASKERQQCLFHLLPYFNVSEWMIQVWEQFYQSKHSQFITVALIVNEQNHIEKHVIKNKTFQKNVLQTLSFQIQQLLQFQKVIFPYYTKKGNVHLAGLTITDFQNVDARIKAGKKLYAILFGVKEVFRGCLQFADNHQHTASRSDYWPHIFSHRKGDLSSTMNTKNICLNNNPVIYSPRLEDAWPVLPHTFEQNSDWYKGQSIGKWFEPIKPVKKFNVTNDYCDSLDILIDIQKSKSKK